MQWGAGPRASQYLVLGAKARAVLMGRYFVTHEDIRAIAPPVLRHRLKTNFNADAAGVTADEVIRRLLAHVPITAEEAAPRGIPDVFRLCRTKAKQSEVHLRPPGAGQTAVRYGTPAISDS